jgi:Polyketide cyclase / dehydrase and lipid transport
MSRRREIDIRVQTAAGPEVVFDLLADGNAWPSWSPIESVELERLGNPPPEGVGAIRINRRGRVTGRDEIIEVAPALRFAYRSLSGLPVRDYVGEVDVEPTATGASIRWRASFFPKVPGMGRLLERGVGRFLADCAQGLADYAAASTAGRPESERAGP